MTDRKGVDDYDDQTHRDLLEGRLKALERMQRWLYWLVGALFVAVLGLAAHAVYPLLGAPPRIAAGTVIAKEFLLVDDQGHVRGSLRQQP
jgi:hypothetical protein